MDAAGRAAALAFMPKFESLSGPERVGAEFVIMWITDNYRAAGYKRLCRFLVFSVAAGVVGLAMSEPEGAEL